MRLQKSTTWLDMRNAFIAVTSMILCCAAVVLIILAVRAYLLPLLGW